FNNPGNIALQDGQLVSSIYVEMKNKHNTMNSAAGQKTYIKMQNQLLHDDDCACFLVEAIARHSQNVPWAVSVDQEKKHHKLIRRVSLDKFYEIVTGDPDAFYKLCMALPSAIDHVIQTSTTIQVPQDSVMEELVGLTRDNGCSFPMALYLLGFGEYVGF
ncbi:MAG: Eco47II family restriction endonuclease, partial [Raoultibacter sp.]